MSLRLRILIALAVVSMLILMTGMIRKKKIDLRDSLIWYILSIIVLMLDAFPRLLYAMAKLLGVALPANMIFLLAILLLISLTFILTATISELSTKVRKLTQEVALLKEELELLDESRINRDINTSGAKTWSK